MKVEEEQFLNADEFPHGYFDADGVDRRSFMKLMAASLALAGVTGCNDKPVDERILPYVNPPEAVVPGRPLFFASAMPMNGYGRGVLVATREGRPIKIEGNPDHPASLGASDAFMQASVLELYDPDRSKSVMRGGYPSDWQAFYTALHPRLTKNGQGIRILSGPTTSPTIISLQQQLLKIYPAAKWYTFDPIERVNTKQASQQAFGKHLNTHYDFSKAQVVVSLDCDFLFEFPDSLRYARQFIDGRRVRANHKEMNRLYVIESTLSLAGAMADHRRPIRPSELPKIAQQLASNSSTDPFIAAILHDLSQHHGSSLILAGEAAPPEVHLLAHSLNAQLGNIGQTITYTEPDDLKSQGSLKDLLADMENGNCDTLFILGENPAYTAPADIPIADALEHFSRQEKNFSVHLTLHDDETSFRCQWTLPESHYLESWSDIRAYDGTASIIQPTIQPLYDSHSTIDVLNHLLGNDFTTAYETVRQTWRGLPARRKPDFEEWWSNALTKGVINETRSSIVSPQPRTAASQQDHGQVAHATELELVIRPDYTTLDGRFASVSWLQELPKPFTKLTWDNAALMSPSTAQRLNINQEEVAQLTVDNRSIEASVLTVPGLPDNVITIHLGYGRTRAGFVGTRDNIRGGVDAYKIRTTTNPWSASNLQITNTHRHYQLVTTRSHHAMTAIEMTGALAPHAVVTEQTPELERDTHNRTIIRNITLEQFKVNPDIVKELGGAKEKRPLMSLYPGPERTGWDFSHGYQWGMSIDTNACISCNACVIACQAENNIPVVGKIETARQREMHWIRIDSYFSGDIANPDITNQPVPCMHCEQAPCEYVCPTGATTHSDEGLNQMTYNRCVGTRYCSNNCPYKVRRFNFLPYTDYDLENPISRKLQRNPEVTVRTGGVMEKCSYCIQRIQLTRIDTESMIVQLEEKAKQSTDPKEKQDLLAQRTKLEFEMIENLQTACQQACPTEAIVFGSIREVAGKTTKVAALKAEPLDYSLLRELNTKPRTTYMARFRNPSPMLESATNKAPSTQPDGGAA